MKLYSNVDLYESTVNEISYNSHFLLNRQKTMVILETNMGEIHINVDADKAPITAKNFIDYVEDGFFEDTIFHRVIPNFMIQCGGMTEDMQQKPTKATIENEAKNGLKNNKYSVAMARTTAPHSASSQFFINIADNQFLDFPGQDGWGYCVFGEVVTGQDVVDKIQSVETLNLGGHADVPASPIIVTKAFIQD